MGGRKIRPSPWLFPFFIFLMAWSFPVQGGGSPAVLFVDPANVDFGFVDKMVASFRTVTIFNFGEGELSISSLDLAGTNPSNFEIPAGTDACTGAVLLAFESCAFDVGFTPDTVGAFSAQVDIQSNDPSGTVTVSLAGTGIEPTDAIIQISPASPVDFGRVGVGFVGLVQIFTVTNVGGTSSTLNIDVLNITDSGNFTLGNDQCSGAALLQGESCTAGVAFTPQTDGMINGTLNVPSPNAVSGVESVDLTGMGASPLNPVLTVSPTNVNFGSVGVNGTGIQAVTVKNTGLSTLVMGDAAISGSSDFSFSQDNCSGEFLVKNEECTIILAVLGTTPGSISGQLTLPSNDPLGPALLALAATITGQAGAGVGGCSLDPGTAPLSNAGAYVMGVLALLGLAWLRVRRG